MSYSADSLHSGPAVLLIHFISNSTIISFHIIWLPVYSLLTYPLLFCFFIKLILSSSPSAAPLLASFELLFCLHELQSASSVSRAVLRYYVIIIDYRFLQFSVYKTTQMQPGRWLQQTATSPRARKEGLQFTTVDELYSMEITSQLIL